MATLFISDLHLCAERPALTELFLSFVKTRATQAEALYILGDFFEFWVGDDVALDEEHRQITEGLQELASTSVPVYLAHGNRDFLLGKDYESLTGIELLPEPACIDLYGRKTLIMHGDTLCTDDTEYQQFRAMVRTQDWQQAFLAKPLAERRAIFHQYRRISMEATETKKMEIMDVNQQAVTDVMRAHGVTLLIHGHTHRPGEHHFTLDGADATRLVLSNWDDGGSVLIIDRQGWRVEALSLTATIGLAKTKQG